MNNISYKSHSIRYLLKDSIVRSRLQGLNFLKTNRGFITNNLSYILLPIGGMSAESILVLRMHCKQYHLNFVHLKTSLYFREIGSYHVPKLLNSVYFGQMVLISFSLNYKMLLHLLSILSLIDSFCLINSIFLCSNNTLLRNYTLYSDKEIITSLKFFKNILITNNYLLYLPSITFALSNIHFLFFKNIVSLLLIFKIIQKTKNANF